MKRSEDFNVAITELQHYLISPHDDAGCILSIDEHVQDPRHCGRIGTGISRSCRIPLRIGALEDFQASIFQEVRILENKISEVENELHVAKEELRILQMERRDMEAQGLTVMGAAGA